MLAAADQKCRRRVAPLDQSIVRRSRKFVSFMRRASKAPIDYA
jgi:hypothetical protein